MTEEHPEQCPVCGHEYAEREQCDSATSIDCPTHSRICVQRAGTKFDVYRHDKIPIELVKA
jgi:hypothetical protein